MRPSTRAALRLTAAIAVAMASTLLILLGMFASGCTAARQPTVIAIRADSVAQRVDSVRVAIRLTDTIVIRDSVDTYRSGDTLIRTELRLRERWRTRTDTLTRTLRDTVRIRTPVPVAMPAKDTAGAGKTRKTVAWTLAAIAAAGIIAAAYKLIKSRP